MDGGFLGEEQVRPVKRQVAVNFVCGNLVIPGDAELPAGVHQHLSAQNVGLQEYFGIFDGAVNVALRREVHHHIRVLFRKELANPFPVADVQLHEPKIGIFHHGSQGGQVPRVGQFVQANDPVIRVFAQHMENKVGADKSGTAGYNNRHSGFLNSFDFPGS